MVLNVQVYCDCLLVVIQLNATSSPSNVSHAYCCGFLD